MTMNARISLAGPGQDWRRQEYQRPHHFPDFAYQVQSSSTQAQALARLTENPDLETLRSCQGLMGAQDFELVLKNLVVTSYLLCLLPAIDRTMKLGYLPAMAHLYILG